MYMLFAFGGIFNLRCVIYFLTSYPTFDGIILTFTKGISTLPGAWNGVFGARICKRLRSPGIDSKEPIPPAYVSLAGRYVK